MSKIIAIIYDNNFCYTKKISNHIQNGISAEKVRTIVYKSQFISDNLHLLDKVDTIIFGTPTYFGNVSTNIKKFMDSTTSIWHEKKWNNKIAAGFTHSTSLNGDKLSALMSIFIFAQQHGMIWSGLNIRTNEKTLDYNINLNRMGSWIGLMVESIKKGQDINISDIKTAEYFGVRIAKVTKHFN